VSEWGSEWVEWVGLNKYTTQVTQIKSHFPFSPINNFQSHFPLSFFTSWTCRDRISQRQDRPIRKALAAANKQTSNQSIHQASKQASKQASNFVQKFFSLRDFNYGLFAIQRLKICFTRFASSSSSSSCPILLVINIPSCTSSLN